MTDANALATFVTQMAALGTAVQILVDHITRDAENEELVTGVRCLPGINHLN